MRITFVLVEKGGIENLGFPFLFFLVVSSLLDYRKTKAKAFELIIDEFYSLNIVCYNFNSIYFLYFSFV